MDFIPDLVKLLVPAGLVLYGMYVTVKLMLEREADFKLLGEASDGLEAVQLADKVKPDVLLLDLMLPRLHGLEVIRQVRRDSASEVTPLRLQAYERMALFLERITPANLLLRLSGEALVALDLQQLLLREIREEYNHNVSQQIYMSQAVWEEVQNAMNEVIMLVNEAAGQVPPESPALELSKRIFDIVIQKNSQPTAAGLKAVKDEVQAVFL